MILVTRYKSKPKIALWNSSKKFMSVKIHVLNKASAVKLLHWIRRYFAKQREINGLFYFIAEYCNHVSVSSSTTT